MRWNMQRLKSQERQTGEQQTRDRLVPNGFSSVSGSRMSCTRRADAQIEESSFDPMHFGYPFAGSQSTSKCTPSAEIAKILVGLLRILSNG